MWWLVATYGNHTRAVLLHDALIQDSGVSPPVERKTADALLLAALKEGEPGPAEQGRRKKGVFRHWLMWAAVAVFGTMDKLLAALFTVHVYAVWGFAIGGAAWAWGDLLWRDWAPSISFFPAWAVQTLAVAVGVLIAFSLLLLLLGGAWRAGIKNTGGWAFVLVAVAALLGVLLWLARPSTVEFELPSTVAFEWSPFTLLALALALHVLGVFWGLAAADRALWRWLWPTALIGLPIAALPVGLIFLSVYLVGLIDVGAAVTRALQTDERTGKRYRLELPDVKPTQFPI